MEPSRFEKLCKAVEINRQSILDAHDFIWNHAESGFKEWETSKYLESAFESLGYELHRAGDIPGFYADWDTGRPGPRVLVIGEMDSLIIPQHPAARKDTHCVHACGHHAQSAALLGLASALQTDGIKEGLCGSVRLMAVPAEELTELEYRESLRTKGIIHYFGGKQEFLYRGYMDGVDMAFMVHTSYGEGSFEFPNRGDDGFLIKTIEFIGKATHAGIAPHLGVNALLAQQLAVSAMNALRETFIEEDYARLQMGSVSGDSLCCRLDLKIRAATIEKINRINIQINRAIAGAAASIGAGVRISDRPGYMPLYNDPVLGEVFCDATKFLDPDHPIEMGNNWSAGCTDMGDISELIPSIHPYSMGAAGRAHTAEYYIESVEKACVMSAKSQLLTLQLLLENDAERAKRVIGAKKTRYRTKEELFADVDQMVVDRELIETSENGSITLKI